MGAVQEPLPWGLRWDVEPASWRTRDDAIEVVAAPRTDNFIAPDGRVTVVNGARALATAPPGRWQFSARVSVDFRADFDAGVLLLWSDDRHFAKLCFERSPQGEAMVVSVVTRQVSDDANAWVVDGDGVWLRISDAADGVYAFHASVDGDRWEFVRYFALTAGAPMRYGIAAQSPVGSGCTTTFTGLTLTETALADLRDGS
jgi:regulation of enolase protein 1 (concanavalin A-like superfamily)